jgi:hypothetical protein
LAASTANSASSTSQSAGGSLPKASQPTAKAAKNSAAGKFSDVDLEWAKRQIGKYDKNADGTLSKDEWEKMIVKPDGADKDRDGRLTPEEYAAYRASK